MENDFIKLSQLFEASKSSSLEEKLFNIAGWIATNRNNGQVGFISIYDGSTFKNVQVVYDEKKISNYAEVAKLNVGACISVKGELILTPNNKQPFEINANEITLLGAVAEDFPLQKKAHSFEFLRDLAHLRPKANTFKAVFRVRNCLSMAIHNFFQENGFMYVHTPILTSNDCEGAGETFKVCTGKNNSNSEFFGKNVYLTVSGQLHVEPFALAYGNVYTFGPTFRAENSNTKTHASEFWMIEPEMAFCDLNKDMEVIEKCIKYCIKYVLDKCPDELEFFNSFIDKTLKTRLTDVLSKEFKKIDYADAVKTLQDDIKNSKVTFKENDVHFGTDFGTEHERYITEKIVGGPVFIYNFPKEMKSFYMRNNDDGRTVAAADLLLPQVGELVGASQREERYDVLKQKMEEVGNMNGLEWYLETRKYGCCYHSGFGIGFERFLMYVTGMENIRDVEPYPRTSNQIKY